MTGTPEPTVPPPSGATVAHVGAASTDHGVSGSHLAVTVTGGVVHVVPDAVPVLQHRASARAARRGHDERQRRAPRAGAPVRAPGQGRARPMHSRVDLATRSRSTPPIPTTSACASTRPQPRVRGRLRRRSSTSYFAMEDPTKIREIGLELRLEAAGRRPDPARHHRPARTRRATANSSSPTTRPGRAPSAQLRAEEPRRRALLLVPLRGGLRAGGRPRSG